MRLQVKRVYETAAKKDGTRVLVDRLWPRGIKKETAHIDLWIKACAPSNALRTWFHADPEKRFAEFQKRYSVELREHRDTIRASLPAGTVTLITSVKDIERSHIPALKKFLVTLLS